ncbi:hypothetical protein PP714_11570, partial [Lacticaseibacillus paracasei]|nr:hypothetical protein [Lacticaseibacillus paracasei]
MVAIKNCKLLNYTKNRYVTIKKKQAEQGRGLELWKRKDNGGGGGFSKREKKKRGGRVRTR